MTQPAARTPNWRVGAVVSVTLALLVAMQEINRLSGQVVDTRGGVWSITALLGPSRLLRVTQFGHLDEAMSQGWVVHVADDAQATAWTSWLIGYLVLDLVFVGIYLFIVSAWLIRRQLVVLGWALRVVATLEVTRDVLALMARGRDSQLAALWAGWASAALWSGFAVVLVMAAYSLRWPAVRNTIWRQAKGVYFQRFSLLAIVPVAFLTVPAGSDLFDQLPDVQRRWADSGELGGFAVAAVAVAVVALSLFVFGRLRSGAMWRRALPTGPAEATGGQPARLGLGLLIPAFAILAFGVIWVTRGEAPGAVFGLERARLLVFFGIPTAIVLLSWLIRQGLAHQRPWIIEHFQRKPKRILDEPSRVAVARTGDALAAMVVVVGGVGLVRSFTGPLALEQVGLGTVDGDVGRVVALLVLGVMCCAGVWPALQFLDSVVANQYENAPSGSRRRRLAAALTPTDVTTATVLQSLGLLAFGLIVFFGVGVLPNLGWDIGLIPTILGALLGTSLVVGGIVLLSQDTDAPELFWFVGARFRSLPVASLLLITIAWSSGIGSQVDLHGIDGLAIGKAAPAGLGSRPTLDDLVKDWSQGPGRACGQSITVDGRSYRLRPMLVFAAEGGGIRAAYWAAAGIDIIAGRGTVDQAGRRVTYADRPGDPCATALFAGGASGGAVGEVVAQFAGSASAQAIVAKMAETNALTRVTDGLFVRDPAYAATGIPFFGHPSFTGGQGWRWSDRASLMEQSWAAAGLTGDSFLADRTAITSSATGALILNSTRVADGCRMWVSQVSLPGVTASDCSFGETPAGHSLDLLANVSSGTGDGNSRCLGSLSPSTAAMLAARFSFVTPSGLVGPCGDRPFQQFVDGGYADNFGLATVRDLAPTWLSVVRQSNSDVVQAGRGGELIVPSVVYFDNGTGSDLVKDPPGPTSEVMVPSTTIGRAKAALEDSPALLRNDAEFLATDQLFASGSMRTEDASALKAVASKVDSCRLNPVSVVYQATFPAVDAPLGWALSQESRLTMDQALADQATGRASATKPPTLSTYGSLKEVLDFLAGTPKPGCAAS